MRMTTRTRMRIRIRRMRMRMNECSSRVTLRRSSSDLVVNSQSHAQSRKLGKLIRSLKNMQCTFNIVHHISPCRLSAT